MPVQKGAGTGRELTGDFFSGMNIPPSRHVPPVVASVWEEENLDSWSSFGAEKSKRHEKRKERKGGMEGRKHKDYGVIVPVLLRKCLFGHHCIFTRIKGRHAGPIILLRECCVAEKTNVDLLISYQHEWMNVIQAEVARTLSSWIKKQNKVRLTFGCFLLVPCSSSLTSSPLGVSLQFNCQSYLNMMNRDRKKPKSRTHPQFEAWSSYTSCAIRACCIRRPLHISQSILPLEGNNCWKCSPLCATNRPLDPASI